MPTSVTYTIPISGGEHVIRFLNLSGDEIFLGNVPVSFAEVLTETGTPLEAVNSTWRQGVSITESLTAIVELELGSDLRETATALDSLQAFHAMLTSESEEALADEASDSTATNIEPSEIDESLTGVAWGTLLVNLLGSYLIGLVQEVGTASLLMPEAARLFLAVGVLGGLTTYSSFSYETVRLLEAGAWWQALANVVVTTALCLVLCVLGIATGRLLVVPRG